MINDKYYVGFEGEAEIHFICKKEKEDDVIIIWEGYFDQIMHYIVPEKEGWTGLAYYYHLYLGWYDDEESPWLIDDLNKALEQFSAINPEMLSNKEYNVLKLICNMYKEALDHNLDVFIYRE